MFVLITNSNRPYCFDIGHVMGLPAGGSYRFRYRKKWIAPDLGDLEGKTAVVVLRDFHSADLIPCRFAKISKVHPSGDFLWIEFELRGYLGESDLEQLPGRMTQRLGELNAHNEASRDLNTLVFSMNYQQTKSSEDESTRWDRIVSKLGRLQCYADYSFALIVGAVSVGASLTKDQNWNKALQADHVYDFYVLQKLARKGEVGDSVRQPYAVVLSSEDGRTEIIRSHQRVVGKYDLLRYSFRTSPAYFSDCVCALALGAKADSDEGFPYFPDLSFQFPVTPTIKRKIWSATRIVVALLALILFIVPAAFADCTPLDENGIRAVGMFLTLVATGSLDEILKIFASGASKRIGE